MAKLRIFELPRLTTGAECLLLGTILWLWLAGVSVAQSADTVRFEMDALVVTAERADSRVASTIGSFSQIRLDQMLALPVANMAGLLSTTPGVAFLNRDGEGNDPLPVVRGFYGGGTVEYLVVMVDGTPVNQVESGLVNWDGMLTGNVESIEMLRGGASALYGDAAIGGLINVRTSASTGRAIRVETRAGSFGMFGASASIRNAIENRRSDAAIDIQTTDGFRDHGARSSVNLNLGLGLLNSRSHQLDLRSENQIRDIESPGYLPSEIATSDAAASLSVFRSDGTQENVHRLVADGRYDGGPDWHLRYSLEGDYRNADIVGTVLLTPEFADSKLRELETMRVAGSAQFVRDWDRGPVSGRLQAGVDLSKGIARSDYFNVQPILQSANQPSRLEKMELDESGESDRTTAAGYAQVQLVPMDRLLISLGGRLDHLSDTFSPLSEGVVPASSTDHTALSPKIGVNYGYAVGPGGGHFYASVSRSFKAPTLDQLYDQRTIPVPFPPYKISLSNGQLEPQTGTQFEAGVYQRVRISTAVSGELQLSVYRIDLVNELDFSLEEFRYVNIGESQHDGIESSLSLFAGRTTAGFSYSLQDAYQTAGDYKDHQLKAVPRHMFSASVQTGISSLFLGATLSGAAQIYLDDANTVPLSDYVTADVRVGYRFRSLTLSVDVFNLLDKRYSTTGFLDPSGGPTIYLYPSAARRVQAALSIQL